MLSVIGRKSVEKNYETNCKKQIRKNSGLKIIQKLIHTLFVTCKGYENLFNDLIDLTVLYKNGSIFF